MIAIFLALFVIGLVIFAAARRPGGRAGPSHFTDASYGGAEHHRYDHHDYGPDAGGDGGGGGE